MARLINGLRTLDLIGLRPDCKGNPRRSYCRATRLGFVRIYPSELISLLTLLSNLSWNLPLFTHVSLGFQSFYGSLITTSAYLLAVLGLKRWILSLSFSLSPAIPSKILTIRFFIGLLFSPPPPPSPLSPPSSRFFLFSSLPDYDRTTDSIRTHEHEEFIVHREESADKANMLLEPANQDWSGREERNEGWWRGTTV